MDRNQAKRLNSAEQARKIPVIFRGLFVCPRLARYSAELSHDSGK